MPSNQTPRNLGFASDEDHEFYEDFYDADDTMWDGSDDGVPFTVNPNGVSKKQASKSANPSSSENVKPLEHDATADLIMAYRNDLAGESHAPNNLVLATPKLLSALWGRWLQLLSL